MKRIYLICVLLSTLLCKEAKATHIFAADLLYTHITGNTYKVTLVLYGDCGAASSLIYDMYIGDPYIYVKDGGVDYTMLILAVDSGSGEDVSPVCPQLKDSTTCTYGNLPGIRRFSYSDTVTLPNASANWQFIYMGRIGNNSQGGRSSNITNIGNVGGQLIYLVATLNNLNGPNSSPICTTIPTPYYCVNINQQYNPGATDADMDSLWFEMVSGLDNGNPVIYVNPFTAEYPLSAPDFLFNGVNGQMTFTPDILQNALVVNKISEYKNGTLVGSTMREMTFIVTPCQNVPPNGDLATNGSNITGGVHEGNNIINVCKKNSNFVSFRVDPDDQNLHDIIVTVINTPPGANIAVTGDSTTNPVLDFSWDITTVPPGVYTFYVNYKDDGCPLVTNKIIAYTIRIADPYGIAATVIEETHCQHQAYVQMDVTGGLLPRTVVLSQGSNIIETYTDSTGIITDSLAPGNYTVTVSNPWFSCDTSVSFVINNSGIYPDTPGINDTIIYCQYDVAGPLNPQIENGATANWYDENGNLLSGPPFINTNVPGSYTWYVSQTVDVCQSGQAKVDVIVSAQPVVEMQMKQGKICLAEKVLLQASGASTYYWEPAGKVVKNPDGTMHIQVLDSVVIRVIGVNDHGCKDTAETKYTQLEECCKFWYPNAFTPNNDGKNDIFRPIIYGEMENYDLFIYNRFGEVVFHTSDQYWGWDGKYKGQLCDVGMYYYLVKAKCFTGNTEFQSDAVDLIR